MHQSLYSPSFRDYLLRDFPCLLGEVVAGRPRPMGRHHQRDCGIVLQPSCLSALNSRINRMERDEQARFAVALFWVVALDQWMWATSRADYPAFRARTRFPKLVGNCKSACYNHQPPKAILLLVGADGDGWSSDAAGRMALLRETSYEVEALIGALAQAWELPTLHEAARRELTELGIWTDPTGPLRPQLRLDPVPTNWLMPPAPASVDRAGQKPQQAGVALRPEHRPAFKAIVNRTPTREAPKGILS